MHGLNTPVDGGLATDVETVVARLDTTIIRDVTLRDALDVVVNILAVIAGTEEVVQC